MKVRLLAAGRHRVNRGRAAEPLFLSYIRFKQRQNGRIGTEIPPRPGGSEFGPLQTDHAPAQRDDL
jgi:hypothetical protein